MRSDFFVSFSHLTFWHFAEQYCVKVPSTHLSMYMDTRFQENLENLMEFVKSANLDSRSGVSSHGEVKESYESVW